MYNSNLERPNIVGGEFVDAPYPIYLEGEVLKGFGRGSKELGIPTANLPAETASLAGKCLETGIYYGFAQVSHSGNVYPMVMSFGACFLTQDGTRTTKTRSDPQ